MVRPVTKYAVTIEDPESVRYHTERALYEARSGRGGPVWLDVPLDVQAARIDPESLACFTPPVEAVPALAAAAHQVLGLLAKAQRPVLLAGHGVRLAGAAERLRKLAGTLDLPVATTWNALDLIAYDDPLSAGRPGVVALRGANFAIQTCDLLIAVGCRLDNVVTAYNLSNFAPRARKVVVDVDRHELDKLDIDTELTLRADAGDFIDACLEASATTASAGPRTEWKAQIARWKKRYPPNPGTSDTSNPGIGHYELMAALSEALGPDTLIATGSSGLAIEAFYTAFLNKPGQRVFLTSGLGAMGYGLAAAIGACVAAGRKPMVAVESDGSLMMNLQELATLKALGLPIVLVIMNNGGYASIRNTQRNYFNSRFLATGPESGLYFPDFRKVAAAFELSSVRIERSADLASELARVIAGGEPVLCEIMLRKHETLAPKVAAVPRADGTIISMPLEDMSPLLSLEELRAEIGVVNPASAAARAGS
jgi:acetolactate synthase-1/2/3 large subunit